ncbi:MAG TPA: SRPBCC family protein [Tepidisphaeraceae bacterium]|jgi:hypothetical protein
MRIRINDHRAVDCRATLEVPLPAISVWGQIRDFPNYARQDFFHADPSVAGGVPRAGADIVLYHRYMGLSFRRVGRILVWREGVGYSFSDLSLRGPRSGFPHVFSYRIEPAGTGACRLHIRVRGLWTASRVPRLLARAWLWWVFAHVVRSVENQLLVYRVWRKRREQIGRRPG